MKFLAVLCLLVGYAASQMIHGHDLNVLMANLFNQLDSSHDKTLQLTEFEAGIKHADDNGDGTLTCDEYAAHAHSPPELAREILKSLDPNHDCSLTHADAMTIMTQMDQTGDGLVSEHEFEHFYTQLMKHLGHLDHHHVG